MNQAPRRRLAALYFAYFGGLGVFAPYWTLYLQSLTFSPSEIGELMAVITATRVIAPALWGWFSDRTGQRMVVVRACNLLAVISFAAVLMVQDYWSLMAAMLVFGIFWNAILPQVESTTLSWLGNQTQLYSQIRLWGSVGFIIAAVGIGEWLESQPLSLVPWLLGGFFIMTWLISLPVPESPQTAAVQETAPIGGIIRRPEVIALFVVCFLMQISHAPYYTFYSIYLKSYGYSGGTIGWLWGLGVIAEILVFLFMHRLHGMFHNTTMLWQSMLLAALRWGLVASFPNSLSIMIFAQLLHAASFGLYHAVAIQLIHRYFTGPHQVRGQALYSSLGFGLGTALGTWVSGYTWEISPHGTFWWAASACVIGFLVSWRWLKS